MGMFGKKDGKFIVLLVRSAAVSLVEVGAGGTGWVWWCGFGTCGDVRHRTQDCI